MTTKKLTAAALALLLSMALLLSLPGAAWAEKTYGEPQRFNVVLVVDKSGSLCCENGTGTDPDGLRFDALRLFLALLAEEGNNVGAVVFDEHIRYEAPIRPLSGMEEKQALIHEVEGYFPGYDTDIGSAMLRATEMLRDMRQENDLPCMILLFSDGMTDFTTGDLPRRFRESWANAEKAVETAQEEDIVINGILLNVEGKAERGREEFRLYTYRTAGTVEGENGEQLIKRGEFEEVQQAADLAPAFRRLYRIVTNAAYTGDQRVSFNEQGEAEISFTVPSFGVEEVNVIVEGEELRPKSEKSGERLALTVLRPSGEPFQAAGHSLDSSRYMLVKIPEPDLGIWHVLLKGKPDDWVDVAMVGNPTLRVTLTGNESVESYTTGTLYTFEADVADPSVPALGEEQLRGMNAVLVREDLVTGAVHEYAAESLEGSTFTFEPLSFPRGGEYALSAVLSLGDFKVPSDRLTVMADAVPLVPTVDSVSDMLQYGRFRDGVWELELDKLFGVERQSGLQYSLSDDCDGTLSIAGGVLQARPHSAEPMVFTVTAKDLMDQQAQISFDIQAPSVSANTSRVSSILENGLYQDGQWEAALDDFFDDPKGGALSYTLSGDRSGAVTVSDGVVRASLEDNGAPLSFAVTATDMTGQSAKLTFDLSVPTVTAKLDKVTNMMRLGQLQDCVWTLPLDGLFYDTNDSPLTYTLSDSFGGAVTVEDGALRADFRELREAAFDLTATNTFGRQASIPFSLKLPGPAVSGGAISETIKTGLFQAGVWETRLDTLFSDPKGTALRYKLSDDFGGAVRIENGTLHVDMKGLKKADFTVTATDEYGMSAELPVTLTGKNMTLLYALLALGGLAGAAGIPAGIVYWLKNR